MSIEPIEDISVAVTTDLVAASIAYSASVTLNSYVTSAVSSGTDTVAIRLGRSYAYEGSSPLLVTLNYVASIVQYLLVGLIFGSLHSTKIVEDASSYDTVTEAALSFESVQGSLISTVTFSSNE
jgi:hypothetical protein